jgi:hypothetical protein
MSFAATRNPLNCRQKPSVATYRTALLILATFVLAQRAHAAPAPERLDRALTNSESCTTAFEGGPTLRVPLSLLPRVLCGNKNAPALINKLSFAFWFPDMTQTQAVGEIDMFLDRQRGIYVPQDKRFRANILFLFFPKQIPNATYEDWDGSEPQVWQIIERIKKAPMSYKVPIVKPSPYPRLSEIQFGPALVMPPAQVKEWLAKGWNPYSRGYAYVESAKSDYALLLFCKGGPTCQGHVQLLSSHLQYRFVIPSEALPHATEFILATNDLIDGWIVR